MNRRNRGLIVVLFSLLGVVALALVLPPSRGDDGPGGTLALRRLLAMRGVDVRRSDVPGPESETFFLPYDLRSAPEARAILAWVDGGGRVLVADPGSRLLRVAGIRRGRPVGGVLPEQELGVDCVQPAVVGVGRIVASSTDAAFAPGPVEALGCFRRGNASFLVSRRWGAGEIVALGGVTPLTNQHLDDADNVVLAWNLLGQTDVAFGDPRPLSADARAGLWSLLPPDARGLIVQAAVVAVLFAVARGRRLGPPLEERLPAPIPASALVVAKGELYRSSRDAAHAGTALRHRFLARAGRRAGALPRADAEASAVLADLTETPLPLVERALEAPVRHERELVDVARQLESIERRVEGA